MTAALDGIRVLDLGEGIAGAYATKLFADFGAEVVKVEPPGGEALRRQGPFKDGVPGSERSGTFFWFNTNKRGVVLDLASDGAGEVFDRLVDWCDVAVETGPPGRLDALGLGWERIHARKPAVSLISITPFGLESPYRDYALSDLTLYGFAGEMYTIGTQDRAPVKMYGTAALVECGAAAATALLAAVTVSELQGIGQRVDFALADAQFNGVDRRHATTIGWEFAQRQSLRAPGPAAGILAGVYPCADGYVEFSGAALRWDRLVAMLDGAEWAQDAKWRDPRAALQPELVEEFNAQMLPWLLARGKREVWEAARRAKVLCAPLLTVDELFADEHFRERGFWQRAEHAEQGEHVELGAFELPGRPFTMPASPWLLRRGAPRLGEHTDEVLGECGYGASELAALREVGVIS